MGITTTPRNIVASNQTPKVIPGFPMGVQQHFTVWCWAACIELVLKHRGIMARSELDFDAQADIATKFFFNHPVTPVSSCRITPGSCKQTLLDIDIRDLYITGYGLSPILDPNKTITGNGKITFEEIIKEIDNNRPVQISTRIFGTNLLHTVIIYGYNEATRQVIVENPADTDSAVNFSWIDNLPNYWVNTFINL
ncbi:MAG: C39 family peptidase [Acidobacteria bacterium]|nr:C39 family peptidase [Acidobacteriota bacterium]